MRSFLIALAKINLWCFALIGPSFLITCAASVARGYPLQSMGIGQGVSEFDLTIAAACTSLAGGVYVLAVQGWRLRLGPAFIVISVLLVELGIACEWPTMAPLGYLAASALLAALFRKSIVKDFR